MAFVVGVVIVYQVLSTDVNAHLKEYATFKAMGYSNTYLLGVVFEEAIILAFTPLLSLSAKNNQERLEHKTFTKNPDFSHSVRK
jgi:hypothetical protein